MVELNSNQHCLDDGGPAKKHSQDDRFACGMLIQAIFARAPRRRGGNSFIVKGSGRYRGCARILEPLPHLGGQSGVHEVTSREVDYHPCALSPFNRGDKHPRKPY